MEYGIPGPSCNPRRIDAIIRGHKISQVLRAVLEMDLFTLLKTPHTCDKIRSKLSIAPLTRALLDALITSSLAKKRNCEYEASDEAKVLDLPEVIKVARELIAMYKAGRVYLIPKDFIKEELGNDIAFASHVLYRYTPNRELMRKIFKALKDHGPIVSYDPVIIVSGKNERGH